MSILLADEIGEIITALLDRRPLSDAERYALAAELAELRVARRRIERDAATMRRVRR